MHPDSNTTLSDRLSANMQKQLQLISQFDQYLADIKQAITEGNADQLNLLLSQQPDEFNQIELIRLQRAEILLQHGYTDNEKCLQQFMQECSDEPLKHLHTSLSKAISKLEKSLLINDLLIRKNQQRVRQTLQILSGHGTTASAGTYSREGNTDDQSAEKHSIALA